MRHHAADESVILLDAYQRSIAPLRKSTSTATVFDSRRQLGATKTETETHATSWHEQRQLDAFKVRGIAMSIRR